MMGSMTRREKEKRKVRYTSAREWADKQDSGFEPTSINLPNGTPFFQLKKTGLYKIDILPYLVGKGNPHADEGMYHYERTYYPHRVTLASGKRRQYCCLSETFGKRCPICDWMKGEGKDSDQETLKSLRPQVRMLWNIIDRNNKEKGVQVYDSAYFKSFGEMLKNKIQAVEEYEDFFKLEGGMTLQLSVNEASFAGQKFNQVTNIEMLKRKEDYPEEILDKTVCLDDCLVKVEYDDLKKIFLGDDDSSGNNGSSSNGSSNGHAKKAKDESLDLDEEDEDEETTARGSDNDDDDDDPDDSDLETDSDIEESEDSDDDDSDIEEDEDDEEEDSEAAPKKKAKKPVKKKR